MVGSEDSVLIREVSLSQSVLYREVRLYTHSNELHTDKMAAWLTTASSLLKDSVLVAGLRERSVSKVPAGLDRGLRCLWQFG